MGIINSILKVGNFELMDIYEDVKRFRKNKSKDGGNQGDHIDTEKPSNQKDNGMSQDKSDDNNEHYKKQQTPTSANNKTGDNNLRSKSLNKKTESALHDSMKRLINEDGLVSQTSQKYPTAKSRQEPKEDQEEEDFDPKQTKKISSINENLEVVDNLPNHAKKIFTTHYPTSRINPKCVVPI